MKFKAHRPIRKGMQIWYRVWLFIASSFVLLLFFQNFNSSDLNSSPNLPQTPNQHSRSASSDEYSSSSIEESKKPIQVRSPVAPFQNSKFHRHDHDLGQKKAEEQVQRNLLQQTSKNGMSYQKMQSIQNQFEQKMAALTKTYIIQADSKCLENEVSPISTIIRSSNLKLPNLSNRSYVVNLSESSEITDTDLLAFIERSECIYGATDDALLVSSDFAGPDDPMSKSAAQFSSIGGLESFDFFNDDNYGAKSNVLVAVIDSGINSSHPDLKNNMWTDSDGSHGYNFLTSNSQSEDDFGHGTKVAGIIAAEANNRLGIAGIIGHNVKLMALKVQDQTGSSTVSALVSAIDYARSKRVDVINISMAGYGLSPSLQSSLINAANSGISIIVAAGNDSIAVDKDASKPVIPAYYAPSTPGMIAVGSVDAGTFKLSSFSNFGINFVETSAPGDSGLLMTNIVNDYSSGRGTSFSAPVIAGAAALSISFLKKNNISYTVDTIKQTLLDSSVQRVELSSSFELGRTLNLLELKRNLIQRYLAPASGGYDEK